MLLLFIAGLITRMIFPPAQTTATYASVPDAAAPSGNSASRLFSDNSEKFVAHRGYSGYLPENSIPAFELAGKMGFWGIETDISETIDGQFVCMHDDDIDRTTNGTGEVIKKSFEELESVRIDTGKNLKSSENLKIPTLKEYLDICVEYNCVAVVEIKRILNFDSFLSEITDSGIADRCIITGNINDVMEIRARNNTIPVMTIGYTPAKYTENLQDLAQITENRGILYNYPQVGQAEIAQLHQQNIICGVWSIDDTDVAQTYLDYGVDFIVTNNIPARLNYMVNENE